MPHVHSMIWCLSISRKDCPIDPYSGEPFHYRISPGEEIEMLGKVGPGQAILWSTGPDGVNDGGKKAGRHLLDFGLDRTPEGFDLVTVVPDWP